MCGNTIDIQSETLRIGEAKEEEKTQEVK